jgi:hypothetical protein
MENIAHTLAGLVLVRAGLGRKTLRGAGARGGPESARHRRSRLARGRIAYIHAHRGITHSLVGGAVLGIGFGAALYALARVRDRRQGTGGSRAAHASPRADLVAGATRYPPPPSLKLSLRALVGLSVLAVMGHIASRCSPNDYGIRLFLPFGSLVVWGSIRRRSVLAAARRRPAPGPPALASARDARLGGWARSPCRFWHTLPSRSRPAWVAGGAGRPRRRASAGWHLRASRRDS